MDKNGLCVGLPLPVLQYVLADLSQCKCANLEQDTYRPSD